jgi:membrane protein
MALSRLQRVRRVLGRTISEFQDDQLTDRAAALTYYSALALFPGMIVLVALVGLLGQYPKTTNALLHILSDLKVPRSTLDSLRGTINGVIAHKGGAGALLGVGALGALWSASAWIGAFQRAVNAIYEVPEGRPFYKRRPQQLAMTVLGLVAVALIGFALVLTGPLAQAIGDRLGVGRGAVTVFNVVKWPVLAAIAIMSFALLCHYAPNVRQPKLRWLTPGAATAVLLWVLVSIGFGEYVAHFGSYNKTYGTLGGGVAFLVWLWLTNLALLLGAELDSEVERERELAQGLPAEEHLTLPLRQAPEPPENVPGEHESQPPR